MLNISTANRTLLQLFAAAVASIAFMSWLRIRPIGVIFLTFFGFWIYRTRCSFRIVAPPELKLKYDNFLEQLSNWRQRSPGIFCACAASFFGAIAFVGHIISGSTVAIILLVLATIISAKYSFKITKADPAEEFSIDKNVNTESEIYNEFLPDVNETNQFVLEHACDLATISLTTDPDDEDDRSEEIPSELMIPDLIPEVNEQSSDDGDNEIDDDLLPVIEKNELSIMAPSETSQSMEFRKGHFKNESSLSTSSSSSEESLSKGLQFPDHTAVDGPTLCKATDGSSTKTANNQEASDMLSMMVKAQTQALLTNTSKILPSLVSGLLQSSNTDNAVAISNAAASGSTIKRRMVTALDSSDDSDFEILETDDCE